MNLFHSFGRDVLWTNSALRVFSKSDGMFIIFNLKSFICSISKLMNYLLGFGWNDISF